MMAQIQLLLVELANLLLVSGDARAPTSFGAVVHLEDEHEGSQPYVSPDVAT